MNYIKMRTSEKERLKYHHMKNCNMTIIQHEIWWIKHCFEKLFKIGFYSKRSKLIMNQVFEKIIEKDRKEYINNTYNSK
jgi:hypothetical protein